MFSIQRPPVYIARNVCTLLEILLHFFLINLLSDN